VKKELPSFGFQGSPSPNDRAMVDGHRSAPRRRFGVAPSQEARRPTVRIAFASVRLRPLAGVAVIVAAWGLFGAASAQPRPDVTLWVPADSVTTGEPFVLTIEGSTPAHRGIAFPSATADSAFGDLEVLSRSDVHTRRVGGGYAIDSVSYTMRTSARDSVRIPPVPIRVDAAVGTLTTFTEPRAVEVRAGHELLTFRRLKEESWGPLGWFGLAVIVGGALYGAAYVWTGLQNANVFQSERASEQRPATTESEPAPYETATRQLRALRSHDLTEPAAIEAFHVALVDAVNTYLSQRMGIATEKRTTEDLLAVLDRRTDVPPTAVEHLRAVLEQADRVKFAAARPDPATATEALQTARKALDILEDAAPLTSPSSDADRQSE
jgi:hypothetical protein